MKKLVIKSNKKLIKQEERIKKILKSLIVSFKIEGIEISEKEALRLAEKSLKSI